MLEDDLVFSLCVPAFLILSWSSTYSSLTDGVLFPPRPQSGNLSLIWLLEISDGRNSDAHKWSSCIFPSAPILFSYLLSHLLPNFSVSSSHFKYNDERLKSVFFGFPGSSCSDRTQRNGTSLTG